MNVCEIFKINRYKSLRSLPLPFNNDYLVQTVGLTYSIQRVVCRYHDDQPVNVTSYRNEMKRFIELEKVSSKDAGTYWVKVFNDAGEVRSSIVNLNVTGRPHCFFLRPSQPR